MHVNALRGTLNVAMPLFTPAQRRLATAIARLGYVNPFLPERIEMERQLLGDDFTAGDDVWSLPRAVAAVNPNLPRLAALTKSLVQDASERLAGGREVRPSATSICTPTRCSTSLFDDFRLELQEMIEAGPRREGSTQAPCWRSLLRGVKKYFAPGGASCRSGTIRRT